MFAPAPEEGISIELDRLTVRALRRAWAELNQSHFRGALRPPTILLAESVQFLSWVQFDVGSLHQRHPCAIHPRRSSAPGRRRSSHSSRSR